eukprot:5225913-Pleurochrysis_carterae.AAC.2
MALARTRGTKCICTCSTLITVVSLRACAEWAGSEAYSRVPIRRIAESAAGSVIGTRPQSRRTVLPVLPFHSADTPYTHHAKHLLHQPEVANGKQYCMPAQNWCVA